MLPRIPSRVCIPILTMLFVFLQKEASDMTDAGRILPSSKSSAESLQDKESSRKSDKSAGESVATFLPRDEGDVDYEASHSLQPALLGASSMSQERKSCCRAGVRHQE